MPRVLKSQSFGGGPVTAVVTRIPQGFDGCSAEAAWWVAFCGCLLKLRLAVGAAAWMPGEGAA